MPLPTDEQVRDAAEKGWSIFQTAKHYACSPKNLKIFIERDKELVKRFAKNGILCQSAARKKARMSIGIGYIEKSHTK